MAEVVCLGPASDGALRVGHMAGPGTCLCRRRANHFLLADMMTMHYSFLFILCQQQSPSRQVHQELPARYPIRTRRGVGEPRADAISPD